MFWNLECSLLIKIAGLCKTKVDFERVSGNSEGGDCQIRIVLPYCSKKLKWEIIFDGTAPWFAPDFRFDDDSFLMNVEEEILEEKLPSLSKWNENDPKALSNVISEMINLYKIHQVRTSTLISKLALNTAHFENRRNHKEKGHNPETGFRLS